MVGQRGLAPGWRYHVDGRPIITGLDTPLDLALKGESCHGEIPHLHRRRRRLPLAARRAERQDHRRLRRGLYLQTVLPPRDRGSESPRSRCRNRNGHSRNPSLSWQLNARPSSPPDGSPLKSTKTPPPLPRGAGGRGPPPPPP